MKTIGILGGLGPEATADYYKKIINGFKKLNENGSLTYPEIIIYSVTMSRFINLLEEGKNEVAANYLVDCIKKIEQTGADFAAISANTPHLLFNEIQSKTKLPLVSIVESCAIAAKKLEVKRCVLIGSKFTMQNGFFEDVFSKQSIKIIVPDEPEIELINKRLFEELELGIFKEDTKNEILSVLDDIKKDKSIDAVILGCTEFPLMFTEERYLDIPFLNTTQIHVDTIIKECIKT